LQERILIKKGLILSLFLHFCFLLFLFEHRFPNAERANDVSLEKISARLDVSNKASPINADTLLPQPSAQPAQKATEKRQTEIEPTQGSVDAIREEGNAKHEVPPLNVAAETQPIAPAEPVVRTPSIDVMRQYGINLARVAGKYKKFPVQARQRGWEGEVGLVVGTSQGLALPVVSIGKSSGFDELDQAAVDMLRRAVREAVIPAELVGKPFALTLPIRFSLED
jgi:protein TonB